jgi:hypothetical protein
MAYLGVINKRLTNNTMIMSDETLAASAAETLASAPAEASLTAAPVADALATNPASTPSVESGSDSLPEVAPVPVPVAEVAKTHVSEGEDLIAEIGDFASFELKAAGALIAKLIAFIKTHHL